MSQGPRAYTALEGLNLVPSSSSWLTPSPAQDLQVPSLVYMFQIVGTVQGFLSAMWVTVLTLLTEAITLWALWLICSFFLSLSSCFPFCPLRSLENILSLFLQVHFRKLLSSEITSRCGSFNLSLMLTFKHRLTFSSAVYPFPPAAMQPRLVVGSANRTFSYEELVGNDWNSSLYFCSTI